MSAVKPYRSGLVHRSQGRQKRLELFAALATHLQVLLNQRHGLGSVQAGEIHIYESIYLLEALVAADFLPLTGLGYLLYHRSETVLVKQFAQSFWPIYLVFLSHLN
jgi:hypothetical protein